MLGYYFLDELEVLIIIDFMWKFIKHETLNFTKETMGQCLCKFTTGQIFQSVMLALGAIKEKINKFEYKFSA